MAFIPYCFDAQQKRSLGGPNAQTNFGCFARGRICLLRPCSFCQLCRCCHSAFNYLACRDCHGGEMKNMSYMDFLCFLQKHEWILYPFDLVLTLFATLITFIAGFIIIASGLLVTIIALFFYPLVYLWRCVFPKKYF